MVEGQESINRSYDKLASEYENIAEKRRTYCNEIDRLVEKNVIGRNLLDIGSGNGERIANIQKKLGIDVYAIEASTQMYELLRRKPNINARKGISQEFQNDLINRFDNVTALWNVLGHIPTARELGQSLDNIYRYLKKDGVFICDVNNRHNIKQYGYKVLGRIIIDIIDFKRMRGDVTTERKMRGENIKLYGHLFNRNEIVSALKDSKFKRVRVKYVDYDNGNRCMRGTGQMFIVASK